ncbi:MAG: nucleotide exchange factor GrpE [Mycoplasmataceae bacterium]|jgi:molecular chaperone GrpE|nr:nucleotide exchange factor GrpE [Mycoplasmataceae bacterium]
MSKHESKQKNQEEQKIEQNKVQPIEDTSKKEINEIEQLMKQIQDLTTTVVAKDEHINKLEDEIKQINQDYVNKVTQKANEANVLLKTKVDELTAKANQELAMHKKYAIEKQAGQLIDIINQFELAVSHPSTDPKIANYQMGFKMFLTMLKNLLSNLGISEIIVNVGDEFNPEFMECIEFVHTGDLADHKVAKIVSKGYKLYDRLVKPTNVVVMKKLN